MCGVSGVVVVLATQPAQAAARKYVIPVRWCGVQEATSMIDPGLASPPDSKDKELLQRALSESKPVVPTSETKGLSAVGVLKARSGSAGMIQAFTRGDVSFVFHATPPDESVGLGRMANDFPIIYSAGWDASSGSVFGRVMKHECEQAWQEGDLLYFDNGDRKVGKDDFLLPAGLSGKEKQPYVLVEDNECALNFGAPLSRLVPSRAMPGFRYGYVDLDGDALGYELGDPIFRYEHPDVNQARKVRRGDVLLYPVRNPGPTLPRDVPTDAEGLVPKPPYWDKPLIPFDGSERIGYVDRFRSPVDEFSVGYASMEFSGIYAISMPDYETFASGAQKCTSKVSTTAKPFQNLPVSGRWLRQDTVFPQFGDRLATREDLWGKEPVEGDEGRSSCPPQTVVLDDQAWMYKNGTYANFETPLVAHEFSHALGLPHGDGVDNNANEAIDDSLEEECTVDGVYVPPDKVLCELPNVPDKGLKDGTFDRTTCVGGTESGSDSSYKGNYMQYCWNFIQTEKLEKVLDTNSINYSGPLDFSEAQFEAMENYAEYCNFRMQDSASKSSLLAQARDFDENENRRVYRLDTWDDQVSDDFRWLDIGKYGYTLTPGSEPGEQKVALGVFFDQNQRENVPPFDLWFGVDVDARSDTGAPGDREQLSGLPRDLPAGLEVFFKGSEVALRARVAASSEVSVEVYTFEDGEWTGRASEGAVGEFQPIVSDAESSDPDQPREVVGSHRFDLRFPERVFPRQLKEAVSLAVAASSGGTLVDLAASRGIRHLRHQAPGVGVIGAPSLYPTCVVTSLDGEPIEKLPRSGSFKIKARGLIAKRPVTLDINGLSIRDLRDSDPALVTGSSSPLLTDKSGKVTLVVQGDQIPFDANRKAGRPTVIAVGAGASTAICGFQFYDDVKDLEWNCELEPEFIVASDESHELNPYACPYYDVCVPGEFEYFAAIGKYCPDGSLAEYPHQYGLVNEQASLDALCLLPVDQERKPNCYNTVFNMPPGADWSVPGLGLAYNATLWREDGSPCTNRSLARLGLNFNSKGVHEECARDTDGDGIPNLTDLCPENNGFCFFDDKGSLRMRWRCFETESVDWFE